MLLSSTGADQILIERADMELVMQRRDGRALLVVDVAVPRDVDPGVAQVFGVTLLDIDALRALGEQSLQQRRAEIGRVREIITVRAGSLPHRAVGTRGRPARHRAARARRGGPARPSSTGSRRGSTTPTRAPPLDAATRALVNKLLHEPTVRLKEAAGTARGELYADALAELFALELPDADE